MKEAAFVDWDLRSRQRIALASTGETESLNAKRHVLAASLNERAKHAKERRKEGTDL